ncbi:solute carrier family 52, riboflavin transporter, member 3-A-like [Venturia canescens]|uniref:solute carrier family 52, riboflavin transporter, member 3-A-like n=1 Tax=Venturia canescens TaxID=32260 RepID=UPI001C9C2190|nr:solute carrier family 52, riboflavin transporter, member 3-A-like [Venturia canescens]
MKVSIRTYVTNGQKYLLSYPFVVHSLVVVFGLSAWIGVNGIFVQLPLLVLSAPEKWDLAAYVVVIIQAANIGPIVYTIAKKCCNLVNEAICISVLLFMGTLAMGFLAFYYNQTLHIGNSRYSVAMFICVFLTALVGCTSSVLFMPYLRNSNEKYLVSYFIGEGLSGVVPSVIALFQGVGGNAECRDYKNGTVVEITADPRFPPKDYFIILFVILLTSFCTFGLLRYLPSIKKEVTKPVDTNELERQEKIEGQCNFSMEFKDSNFPDNVRIKSSSIVQSSGCVDKEEMNLCRTIYLHVLLSFICFLGNGFLPGIQTYSCLPYGNVAFHLTVTLANIANPVACLFSLFYDSVQMKILDLLSVVGMLATAYAIYSAAASPTPPLQNSVIGVAIIVSVWIILTGIISYLKLSITSKIRQKLGPKALIDAGIVMQSGSACGAVLSFVLISFTTSFQQHRSCILL